MAHGDLDLTNVLVLQERATLTLKLVDYDNLWIPTLAGYPQTESGHEDFQHPSYAKPHSRPYNAEMDRFSALVTYLSLAMLVTHPHLYDDWTADESNRLLLSQTDYTDYIHARSPNSRIIELGALCDLERPDLVIYVDALQRALEKGCMPPPLDQIEAPRTSFTKEPVGYDPQSPLSQHVMPLTSERSHFQLEIPTNNNELLNTRDLQTLERALQEGELEKAVEYIVYEYSQAGFSREPIIRTITQTAPQRVTDDAQKLATEAFEQLRHQNSDMKACLNALLAYRWLALASPNNAPALASYWYYDGLAYSYLPEDNDQATIFAAITCYQVASARCKKQRNRELYADIQFCLGIAYNRLTLGDYQANQRMAIACFLTALQYYKYHFRQRHHFRQQQADVHYQLGLVYKDLLVITQEQPSPLLAMEQHLQEALEIYKELKDLKSQADVHYQLGLMYTGWLVIEHKRPDALLFAQQHLRKALEIYGKLEDPTIKDVYHALQEIKNRL